MTISVEKIKSKFLSIKNKGFLPNVKTDHNDGAIGNTFEFYLGVKENNLRDSDFDGWEIKTKKKFSKTATTLFSRKPTEPKGGDKYMLDKYGVPDQTFPACKNLNTSIYANKWCSYYQKFKYKLELDKSQNKLIMLVKNMKDKLIDDSVYWSFNDLMLGAKKLKNTFVVQAEKKLINNKYSFKYINADAYYNFSFDKFLDSIENGVIRYEHRWSPDKHGKNKGKDHNHGGGFRLSKPLDIEKLFEISVKI
jgi:hypothetical protein